MQMLEPFLHDDDDLLEDVEDEHRRRRLLGVITKAKLGDKLILEPSAGSGAMLKVLREILDPRGFRNNLTDKIHAIERSPELRAVLKDDGWKVVAEDFLAFRTNLRYDLILMNPPFSNGDEHLLHAWEVMHEGDIVCLLNASTVKLPYTERRKRLVALIEEHGTVEYIGNAFSSAQRKTDVPIALVRLTKKDTAKTFDFEDNDAFTKSTEGAKDFQFDAENMNTPAVNDMVKLFVDQFKEAQEGFVEYMKTKHRMRGKAGLFITDQHHSLSELLAECTRDGDAKHQYNRFTGRLQELAWSLVFRRTRVQDLMTQSVRKGFEKMQKDHGTVAFTEDNIHALFEMLFLNRGEILKQSILDAFDMMTKYHSENRLQEGWATNDAFKVNKKVILPYAVEADYSGGMRMRYDWHETINDVDRALAMIAGKKLSQIHSAATALNTHFKTFKRVSGALENNVVTCEHFKIRFFKKGTAHLFFLDEELWEQFNITVAKARNWLPMDYGREKQTPNPAAENATQLILNA
jgi:hypothetical protein